MVQDSLADIGSQVFKRFVKGKHSPGHGLGLAFVDAVAQAHGGIAQGLRPSRRRRRYNFIAAGERAPGGISTTFLAGFENPSIKKPPVRSARESYALTSGVISGPAIGS